ncbi:hypothetical protein SBA3_1760014 [Candidatus Sulfopaludibacter sp. SbA3]|nr:hypothetical protein SBA3_1760014 [Candidatus Sulfopaludibacter sp. SbA3]
MFCKRRELHHVERQVGVIGQRQAGAGWPTIPLELVIQPNPPTGTAAAVKVEVATGLPEEGPGDRVLPAIDVARSRCPARDYSSYRGDFIGFGGGVHPSKVGQTDRR